MAAERISFQIAMPEDFNLIETFLLKHFLSNEPTMKALSISKEEFSKYLKPWLEKSLRDPVSLLVLNSKHEVVAVFLNFFVYNDTSSCSNNDQAEGVETSLDRIPCNLSSFDIMNTFFDSVEAGCEKLIPSECHKMLYLAIGCVNVDEYARSGIGKAGLDWTIEKAVTLGCDGAFVQASALASQNLFRKEEFEILKVIKHENFCDENGKQLIKCKDGTNQGQLLFKRLPSLLGKYRQRQCQMM